MYFYSRPRVGGDLNTATVELIKFISTHAPAWGATGVAPVVFVNVLISTHAPAWGATRQPPQLRQ